ncbi:hypothetical protein [Cohnella silvisoli]|uniref:Uncharacterized protein n=1 Tax=Cohnella silvisoli TaxID=2873699 RepID=A0ABV1L360_9BACL|nr:hypothetical protein [Cohnella silvisoli]MCD9026063.1 hypothetical protein [Cohnella silvisoli]
MLQTRIDYDKPLKHYFPVAEECLSLNVSSLKLALIETDSVPTFNRLYNCLIRSGLTTIGDSIQIDWRSLDHMRACGRKSHLLLFSLLKRISENPEQILNATNPVIESPERFIDSSYVREIIKKHRNVNQVNNVKAKLSDRAEEIKRLMREKGFTK